MNSVEHEREKRLLKMENRKMQQPIQTFMSQLVLCCTQHYSCYCKELARALCTKLRDLRKKRGKQQISGGVLGEKKKVYCLFGLKLGKLSLSLLSNVIRVIE